ncbi:MAG: dTDP-4-dehydrorhamnose reductase [Alphaproteobacteria bacterium]
MTDPILVLGKGGQLSRALVDALGNDVVVVAQSEADFASENFISQLEGVVRNRPFSAVINAAAYTQVDKAEEERELAFRVNAYAVHELAEWCVERALPLVHVSTDYVFDGRGDAPHRERDATAPLGVYGQSKRAGEEAVMVAGGDHLIFRTSWLYDAEGKNFYTTMLRLFLEKDAISVVNDQTGAPTYVPQLAQAILSGLRFAVSSTDFPSGLYHLCHSGEATWYEFASAILSGVSTLDDRIRCATIHPIASSEYKTAAARPQNSRLDCSKAAHELKIHLPHWQEGLNACIKQSYEDKRLQHTGTQNRSARPEGG